MPERSNRAKSFFIGVDLRSAYSGNPKLRHKAARRKRWRLVNRVGRQFRLLNIKMISKLSGGIFNQFKKPVWCKRINTDLIDK